MPSKLISISDLGSTNALKADPFEIPQKTIYVSIISNGDAAEDQKTKANWRVKIRRVAYRFTNQTSGSTNTGRAKSISSATITNV